MRCDKTAAHPPSCSKHAAFCYPHSPATSIPPYVESSWYNMYICMARAASAVAADDAQDEELLSAEIVNRGVESSGPYAGSPSFSVRVRRPHNFLNSVNLKYAKLGYAYLITHAFYFLTTAPPITLLLFLIIHNNKDNNTTRSGNQLRPPLVIWKDIRFKCDLPDALCLLGLSTLILYIYLLLAPRSTYLLDFACFRPPDDLKISREKFIELAKKSGQFSDTAIEFQQRIIKNSGLGDETSLPKAIFQQGHKITLKDGREEAAIVMFGVVDDLLAATKIRPKDIGILVVNCGILNTTPSLSAMVINHYKLRHNIHSFNLGGMGCAAGIIAVDLARDLLNAYPGTYALVVSTEAVSFTWYSGKDLRMLLPNCFFRMGAAALLLSSHRRDRWRAKYELKQLVRTHCGSDDRSFESVKLREDAEGKQGLWLCEDKMLMEVGWEALKANVAALRPLVLPISVQLRFFAGMLLDRFMTFFFHRKNNNKNLNVEYKGLELDHVCIQATSKKVLEEIQKNLGLREEEMEASVRTLERFGNTSSSSIWYELAYLEANARVKRGHRLWQVAFGSGFKCNSVVWKSLRNVKKPKFTPWSNSSSITT
ncbi:3-ketoacyl-CoA synthase 15-like [Malania oleifera]|uniref:3-ketoacyl-CoA synthase 15-like n=1 Tax=Malania oleifera TaxID=397392 RepID=UPI0025AEC680|nr:3-ketoacyl-CoA synthase 15-like [Malania oleifera]